MKKELLTYALSDFVRVVCNSEVRQEFLNLIGDFLGSEAHSIDVVRPQTQLTLGHGHELDNGAQAVVNVHHGQASVGSQVTVVSAASQRVVKDLHCVVCNVQQLTLSRLKSY